MGAMAEYSRGFSDLASSFNWGAIMLTLGGYGLFLPTPVFWLCWSILVMDAILLYTVSPYWKWIENARHAEPDQSGESEQCHRNSYNCRAGTVFIKVGMSIGLIVALFYNYDFRQRENKILLFLGLSITLFEGFPHIIAAREEFKILASKPPSKDMQNIAEGHDWNAVIFLIPSAISVALWVTGAIVLGGKLGNILSDKLYWIVISVLVVDFIAEAIHRFDCGNRSGFDPFNPETLPRRRYISNVLRLLIEGFLGYYMRKQISEKSYFSSNRGGKACEWQCEERSRSLLMTMVALAGIQAAVAFLIPLCSRYILDLLPSLLYSWRKSGQILAE